MFWIVGAALAPVVLLFIYILIKDMKQPEPMAGLGVHFYNWKEAIYNDGTTRYLGLCYGGLAGIRFFFSENFGLQAELNYSGYGPYANVGIAYKF